MNGKPHSLTLLNELPLRCCVLYAALINIHNKPEGKLNQAQITAEPAESVKVGLLVSRASGGRNKNSLKAQITWLYPLHNQNKSGRPNLFTVNGGSHLSSSSKRLVLRRLAQCPMTNRRALLLALPATGKPIWGINLWVEEWKRGLSLAQPLSPGRGPLNGALSAPQLPLSMLHLWALAPMSSGRADWTPLCSCGDVLVSLCVCGTQRG